MMRKITRFGVYGICHEKDRLLLVPKKSGPYKGQLDLPGGGLEFGESPEDALKREFVEEVASGFENAHLLFNLSYVTKHLESEFYHVGLIYHILERYSLPNKSAEDEFYWVDFSELTTVSLTPFAKKAAIQLGVV